MPTKYIVILGSLMSRIRSGVDQFLDAANKDYGINYEDYSSILAVLDNIKHQSP